MSTQSRPDRRLATFTGAGYDKGRSVLWQAAWFATMNLVFSAWWLPARFRPSILRAFGASIGDGVLIRHRVRIQWPWKLDVGNDCWIGEGAWLLNLEPITIGHDVCVSQEAFLCTGSHQHDDPAFEFDNAAIQVGAGAWIAARAIVLRGCTVAPDELVPAGSVRSRAGERAAAAAAADADPAPAPAPDQDVDLRRRPSRQRAEILRGIEVE